MIRDIRLQHFRSYGDAFFQIDPSVNIIIGPNASGKTNLLEAILVIAHGGSYRVKDADLVEFGSSWARIDATADPGLRTVKFKTEPAFSKGFEIDEQPLARLHQSRTLPVVLFEPNHLLLLSGSPELRRSFLDDLIEQSDPGYGAVRSHYRRVLAQRNSLLKKNPRGLQEQLFVWNVRLSELGGKLARERHALVEGFATRANDLYGLLSGRSNEIGLSYVTQFPIENYETALLHKLESNLELDVLRGYTASGPHRDDLKVLIDGHEASETASRGETRTLVLALKVMELHLLEEARAMKPIMLLDDVFSELDTVRRQALTQFVANYQTFITTTDADVVAKHFAVGNRIDLSSLLPQRT